MRMRTTDKTPTRKDGGRYKDGGEEAITLFILLSANL